MWKHLERFFEWRHHSNLIKDTFRSWSGSYDVYIYTDESDISVAKVIPGKYLLVNNYRLNKLSETSAKVIIEHEAGHLKASIFSRVVPYLIIFAAFALTAWYVTGTTLGLSTPPKFWIYLIVAAGIIARIKEELFADFHALHHSSEELFTEAYREVADQRPAGLIANIQKWLIYFKRARVVRWKNRLEHFGIFHHFVR